MSVPIKIVPFEFGGALYRVPVIVKPITLCPTNCCGVTTRVPLKPVFSFPGNVVMFAVSAMSAYTLHDARSIPTKRKTTRIFLVVL